MRTERARTVREALGRAAAVAKGALGISSETCAESGRERRTATSAPPAETFNAVANSRKSFPFSSRLRTNTGIASGRRTQLRRSVSGFRRFNPAPWKRTYAPKPRTWGAKPPMGRGRLHMKDQQMGNLSVKTTVIQQQLPMTIFVFCSSIRGVCSPS
jgi:hypothetical protein